MLKVKYCCRGCSLRCASIAIIAIVFPLQTIVVFFGIVVVLIHLSGKEPSSIYVEILDNADDYGDEMGEAVLYSVYTTFTGLYGVIKKKPKKIVKYLIVQVVYLVLVTGFTVWLMVKPMKILKILGLDRWCEVPLAILFVLILGFSLYFCVVVFRYYRELKLKLKNPFPECILTSADIPLRVV